MPDPLLSFVRTLSKDSSWRINELPPTFSEDVLRALDGRGWIEVGLWHRPDLNENAPEDPVWGEPCLDRDTGWYSPQRARNVTNRRSPDDEWSALFRLYGRESDLPFGIRATSVGKGALAEDELSKDESDSERAASIDTQNNELRVLRTIKRWVYDGVDVVYDDPEIPSRKTDWDHVPDYLLKTDLGTNLNELDLALNRLRTMRQIDFLDSEQAADRTGSWRLPDGRVITSTIRNEGLQAVLSVTTSLRPSAPVVTSIVRKNELNGRLSGPFTRRYIVILQEGVERCGRQSAPISPAAAKDAVPLFGDDVLKTVNQLLLNDPAWDWKATKKWLEKRIVKIFDRDGWRQQFGSEPPARKGNVAIVNATDLMKAIQAQQEINDCAFDQIDSLEKRKASNRRK